MKHYRHHQPPSELVQAVLMIVMMLVSITVIKKYALDHGVSEQEASKRILRNIRRSRAQKRLREMGLI